MLPADPRPRLLDHEVDGSRCVACGAVAAPAVARCRCCSDATVSARFGPGGTVWASTVLRVAVSQRRPPYGLAFVDLDGEGRTGPRILAHLEQADLLLPGTRVAVCGATDGDIVVRPDRLVEP